MKTGIDVSFPFHFRPAEVDNESHRQFGGSKIIYYLRLLKFRYLLDRLDFNNDLLEADEISYILFA